MRKWRPTDRCLYVIPEIHGSFKSLQIIVDRIFPLRFSVNQIDRVVFLGDYIDKGISPAEVIDLLIDLQIEYKDQVFMIRGNHEQLLLDSLNSEDVYKHWLLQGGMSTIDSYLKLSNLYSDSTKFPFSRLRDIIPDKHINFIKSLPCVINIDNYIMFHGGIDLKHSPNETSDGFFMFDSSTSQVIKKSILDGFLPLKDSKNIYVSAHNYKSNVPFVYSKYLMLGGGAPSKLILFDVMSMTCAMIKNGKSRIYKHNFKYYE